MELVEIPIFPLNVVLYPEGPLALRVFEPRYLDMVGRCMRDGSCFGVVALQEDEQGADHRVFGLGTMARIVDWDKGSDGLLTLSTRGEQRFLVRAVRRQSDGLNLARVSWPEPEPAVRVPERLDYLANLVGVLLDEFDAIYADLPRRPGDATWLGYRLAELLPLPVAQKQFYLEMEDPIRRLEQLARDVNQMRSDA